MSFDIVVPVDGPTILIVMTQLVLTLYGAGLRRPFGSLQTVQFPAVLVATVARAGADRGYPVRGVHDCDVDCGLRVRQLLVGDRNRACDVLHRRSPRAPSQSHSVFFHLPAADGRVCRPGNPDRRTFGVIRIALHRCRRRFGNDLFRVLNSSVYFEANTVSASGFSAHRLAGGPATKLNSTTAAATLVTTIQNLRCVDRLISQSGCRGSSSENMVFSSVRLPG
jgi:hypothetical protein